MARILVADDEAGLRGMLDVVLRRDGHQVVQAANGEEALKILATDKNIDLLLSDLRMEPVDGLALLAQVRQKYPDLFVVIITAFAEWDTAVRAMRLGAYNFLRKPFDNQIARTLVHRALAARDHYLAAKDAGESQGAVHLVGSSHAIQEIQRLIEQVSTTDSTVLVTGESGTGKELVARAIHYASMRSDGPLVRVNSGALTPSLLESELFGHVKGSFTGAIEDRPGLFSLSNKGTLFLDEVGDLATETQVKLLRVLESGEYCPVGGRDVQTCDVRVVAATNRDLPAMVKAGTFREDLFYRLAVIPIHLPALRERREDIPLLAGSLLSRHAVKLRRGITGFSEATLDAMMSYSWPGNIRELDNRIQRGVALTDNGDIPVESLFGDYGGTASGIRRAVEKTPNSLTPRSDRIEELLKQMANKTPIGLESEAQAFERRLVDGALQVCDDNLTEAAKLLGISFRQMRYKVRQLGLR